MTPGAKKITFGPEEPSRPPDIEGELDDRWYKAQSVVDTCEREIDSLYSINDPVEQRTRIVEAKTAARNRLDALNDGALTRARADLQQTGSDSLRYALGRTEHAIAAASGLIELIPESARRAGYR